METTIQRLNSEKGDLQRELTLAKSDSERHKAMMVEWENERRRFEEQERHLQTRQVEKDTVDQKLASRIMQDSRHSLPCKARSRE